MQHIAFFGLSANPPTRAHQQIVDELSRGKYDQVIVSVCGPRDDKLSSGLTGRTDRAGLAVLGFPNLPKHVQLDLSDLTRMSQRTRTSTYDQLCQLRASFVDATIWCVIGSDLIAGGKEKSEITTTWIDGLRLWDEFPFVIVSRSGSSLDEEHFPKGHRSLPINQSMSSTQVRGKVRHGESISDLVLPDVAAYIQMNNLYRGDNNEA